LAGFDEAEAGEGAPQDIPDAFLGVDFCGEPKPKLKPDVVVVAGGV
jgi:hypothetical protein